MRDFVSSLVSRLVVVYYGVASLFVLGVTQAFANDPPGASLGLTPQTVDVSTNQFINFSGVVESIAKTAQPIIITIVLFALALFCLRFFLRLIRGMGRG